MEVGESRVMSDVVDDGGTDSRTGSGLTMLKQVAPDVATAFGMLVAVRPSGVHDEVLESPPVRAFAEQFATDVSLIDDDLRQQFAQGTGDLRLPVAQMVWIADVAPRLSGVLDQLFGASDWPAPRRFPVRDVGATIDELVQSTARLRALDAITTELVRLRGARRHACRVCSSRRAVAALEAGADETTFDSVDHYEDSDLSTGAKAALALTDAVIGSPASLPENVVARVREHLTDEEAVEVVLRVVGNAVNKIAVALGDDTPEVTEGVQLFVTDVDGVLTTV